MKTITAYQINQKVNALPEKLLQELDDYIDFLKYKYAQKDWSDDLTDEQIKLIEKGRNDIAQGKVISHTEAKEKIKNYIKNKQR
ncbi:MAG: DUF2281 domain-containing protein [Myroides sp.]|nr:DUF2281 domain-containing protein [Myroides sp.]